MRKITEQTVAAFMADQTFKCDNTEVLHKAILRDGKFPQGDHFTVIELHGNEIAARDSRDGQIWVTNAGWATNTTKERLNSLPGVSISQKKGVWYLNGKEWAGEWIKVN